MAEFHFKQSLEVGQLLALMPRHCHLRQCRQLHSAMAYAFATQYMYIELGAKLIRSDLVQSNAWSPIPGACLLCPHQFMPCDPCLSPAWVA